MTTTAPRIVLVGHCLPDARFLQVVITRAVPGALIALVEDAEGLDREFPTADLFLINRSLDGEFTEPDGVALIRSLAARPEPRPALMLISNFEDAQLAAETAGAVPGFGKARAGSEQATSRLRSAVVRVSTSSSTPPTPAQVLGPKGR